uniref:Uncharacterized protein n=1 Tax=viral metagenome TaxID=1070528 RepID=A0A6C0BV51_9ZZZZ
MSTASNVKLIKLLSERYKFDAEDAVEYVKTASKKGRPKKEIEVEQAKDLFDKILEDAGEAPLEKDPALYKQFEKAPEKVNKVAEKEKKAAEKEAKKVEKEKKDAEKEAKKLEKEKKADEKEAKKLEKEKKAHEKEQKAAEKEAKKQVKPVVVAPVKTVTHVESSDDDSSDDDEEDDKNDVVELKPQEKELVVIKHTPVEELVLSSDDEIDEDVNKIVQSVMRAKMAKSEAKKESDDESEEDDSDHEEEEEEVVKVKRVKINGKDYLKSSNNVLYDVETNDAIGVWDENKQEVILNELDEDSYVDEDNNEKSDDEKSEDE